MPGATTTTLELAYIENVDPILRETLNNAIKFLEKIAKPQVKIVEGSNQYTLKHHFLRNASTTYIGEAGTIPNAGNQQQSETLIDPKIEISALQYNLLARRTGTGKGVIVDMLTDELDRMIQDVAARREVTCLGQGDGVIAQINMASPASPVIVDNPGTQWVQRGMLCDVSSSRAVAGTLRGTFSVDAVTDDVTFTSADLVGSIVDNEFLILGGSRSATVLHAPQGLLSLISNTGTVHNINRATAGNEWAQSNVLTAGGNQRAITIPVLQDAESVVFNQSGKSIDTWFSHVGCRNKFFESLDASARYNGGEVYKANTGNFTLTNMDGEVVPWIVSRFAEFNRMYGLHIDDLVMPTWMASQFDREDGNAVWQRSSTTLEYLARYVGIYNFACRQYNSQIRLDNCQNDMSVIHSF